MLDSIIFASFYLIRSQLIINHRQFDQVQNFMATHPLCICQSSPLPFMIFSIFFHRAYQHTSKDTFLNSRLICLHSREFFYFYYFFSIMMINYHFYFLFFIFLFKASLFYYHYCSFVWNLRFGIFNKASFFVL